MIHFRRATMTVLLLLPCTPALAVPITGHAAGQITTDNSAPGHGGAPSPFTVGDSVRVTYTYDLDPPPIAWPRPRVAFDLDTGSGFSFVSGHPISTLGWDAGGLVMLSATGVEWNVMLRLDGDDGWLEYYVDRGGPGDVGFRATLVRAETREPHPNPEPSGLVLGLVGAALAMIGRGWMR